MTGIEQLREPVSELVVVKPELYIKILGRQTVEEVLDEPNIERGLE